MGKKPISTPMKEQYSLQCCLKSKTSTRFWSLSLLIFLVLNLSVFSTGFTFNIASSSSPSSEPKHFSFAKSNSKEFTLSQKYSCSGVKVSGASTRNNMDMDHTTEDAFRLQQPGIEKKINEKVKRRQLMIPSSEKKSRSLSSRQSHIKNSVIGGLIVGLTIPSTLPQSFADSTKQGGVAKAMAASESKSGKRSDNILNGSTAVGKKSMVESLSVILASKKILIPVQKYIEIGQYDPGRTNVNYCTKILRIRRAFDNVVLQAQDNPSVDLDKLDAAIELTAVADNNFSQLDSSIYTLIFIPNEGNELPPNSRKYLVMAQDYYKTVMDSIDAALALGSPQELNEAQKLADTMEYPQFLFKEFKGDFYRAGTP